MHDALNSILSAQASRSKKEMLEWFRQTMEAEPFNVRLQFIWLLYLEQAHEDQLGEKEEVRLFAHWATILKNRSVHPPFLVAETYFAVGFMKSYSKDRQAYAQKALGILSGMDQTEAVQELTKACLDLAEAGNRAILFFLDEQGLITRPEDPAY